MIVIDWGLAKVLDEYGLGDTLGDSSVGDLKSSGSTMAGQVLGTPLYMAPEQATGRIDEIDNRTDIYGLGATLFAILTGIAPHELSQAKSTDNGARGLISAIASAKTPLPREANSQVDPALEAICLKSMAKKRYARYQSASELAEDVQRWMAGEPVSAYQERPLQKIKRWMTHNQKLSQLIGGLLIVVLVSAITLGIVSRQTQQATQHALFEQMRSEGREIEVRITTSIEDLRNNVRFMASLPPIQALIHAPEQSEQEADPKLEQDSKEIWRGRLEKIYTGLLRANSEYLSISYIEISPNDASQEKPGVTSQVIVKVERSLGNRAEVKALPVARLGAFSNDQLIQEAVSLSPDAIKISLYLGDIKDEANPNQYATFQAATPVFDEATGKLYGMVVIEHDFPKVVVDILDSLALHTSVIRAINPKGEVRLIAAPGHEVVRDLKRTPVQEIVPACGAFYSIDNFEQYMSDGTSYVAQKLYLDPTDPATGIGLVLTLEE
ncbi:MAG: serine/threonine protein kinase [Pirellulales bacterium]